MFTAYRRKGISIAVQNKTNTGHLGERFEMHTRASCAAILLVFLGGLQVQAQDVEIGKDLYKKNCRQCHGPTAKGLASYPKLVGQTAEYLTDRLERYRAGERFGPNTPLMAPRAKSLSDEDITNIVTFIVVTFE